MEQPSVAIICVTHRRPELLRQCLQSCVAQDYPDKKLLVVVNPADPVSESVIREVCPSARVIRTHRNLGFFPALNLGIANVDTDYIMVVDDDAWFLTNDALSYLVREFGREPRLGAVTCSLEGPNEKPGRAGDRYLRAFTTGFTMFPRKVVSEWVDYFPDLFFRSAGETFLCTQLWEQMRPVKRIGNARMYHALAATGRSRRDWTFYGIRSQALCAIMREPALSLLPSLASKFVKSALQIGKYGGPLVWAHAWSSVLFHFPEALRFRKPVSWKTYKLLRRLESENVVDVDILREWQHVARAKSAT